MPKAKLIFKGLKSKKKPARPSKSEKAAKTRQTKTSAAEKAAASIKDGRKQIPTAAVADFYRKHGEKATFKHFGSRKAKLAMKKAEQDKGGEVAKAKVSSDPVKTPTGTRRARRRVKKDAPKAEQRKKLQKAVRARPDDATTLTVGSKAKYGTKPDRKKLKKAQKESERRDPDFNRRTAREAEQGGVEIPRSFSEKRDPKMTRDQINKAMRSGYENPEGLSAEDLIKVYEGGAKKRASGGRVRGAGKAIQGHGKALLRSAGGRLREK